MMPDVSATSVPAYGRRPVLTTVTVPHPTSLAGVYRAAARLIAANGHWQGDYLPDPFDRVLTTAHVSRPLSIVAAIRFAVSGRHVETELSERAVSVLAGRLEISEDDPVVHLDRPFECELHVAAWGDVEGRTTESVSAVLYAAADATEVTA
ncbi:DUF6197 family protein [Streptomyces sp. NPDC004031]